MKLKQLLHIFGRPSSSTSSFISGRELTKSDYLHIWKSLPRYPITESNHPRTQNLIAASRASTPTSFYYHAGRDPGRLRTATIESVFRTKHTTRSYIYGYCHLRREYRVFRADKISLA